MKHFRFMFFTLCGAVLFAGQLNLAAAETGMKAKTLDEDQLAQIDCVGCHATITPGIVKQHFDSPHANPKTDEVTSCHDCHGVDHKTMDDHAKSEMPTAETCGECHKEKLKEHKTGKHNLSWMVMKSQIAWHGQPGSITEQGYRGCSGCHKIGEKGLMGVTDGNTGALKSDGGKEASTYRYGNAQCDACHTRHTFKVE